MRVLIADDHALVRSGLRMLLESEGDFEVVAEAGTADEAVRAARLEKPDVETALYRIVQECLTNVIKHARATRVSILLTRHGGVVKAVVEDDGTGFDPAAGRTGAIGLVGMRERLALLGGRLEVESSESGTTIAAEVPAG